MKRFSRMLAMLLMCCMVFAMLPVTAMATDIKNEVGTAPPVVEFANYFSATVGSNGVSTNDHYTMMGIGVDVNGMAYAVMGSDKDSSKIKDLDWFAIDPTPNQNKDVPKEERIYLDDDTTHTHTADESFYNGAQLMIQLPDGSNVVLNGEGAMRNVVGYFLIPLGNFEKLMAQDPTFNLAIDCSETGWDIASPGIEITVNLSYEIEKLVDKAEAEPGDTLTYTIIARNTGDYAISNVLVDVLDILPEGVDDTTLSVTVDGQPHTWKWGTNEQNQKVMILDEGITLNKGATKTYTISVKIKDDYKGGVLENTATIGSTELPEKEDDATTTVHAYFYVHHIYNDGDVGKGPGENGTEMRFDKVEFNDALRNGAKFDVTTANSAGTAYPGMWENTLYGGTFADGETQSPEDMTHGLYNDVYPFTPGENGIGFTPEVNEHYYVWEPTDGYLRPINVAVWHYNETWDGKVHGYHTIAGYPVTAVDRVYYNYFGFVENNNDVNQPEVYQVVETNQNFENLATMQLKSTHLGLSGYLGCYKFPNDIFGHNIHEINGDEVSQIFLPYWVTMDGVKVTGTYERTASYKGLGSDSAYKVFNIAKRTDTYGVSTFGAPSPRTLMASAMFQDTNLTHPEVPVKPAPETVGVEFDPVTAGNSGNVKALNLTADLREFDYDDSWFEVNGERLDAEDQGDEIFAQLDMKHMPEGELTIVPCWQSGDETLRGAELVLEVAKKTIEIVTEEPEEPAEEQEYTEDEYVEESEEEYTEDEYVEESEGESEEYTEGSEEVTEEESEKDQKEAEKAEKKAQKEAEKAEKKSNKESNEESVQVAYEEITTVTFVRSAVTFAVAPEVQDMGSFGVTLQ